MGSYGWILEDAGPVDLSNVKDLEKDWVVVWQEKLYVPLVIFSNILVPLVLGWAYQKYTGHTGSIYGVLLLAGLLRFVLNHHVTFFILNVDRKLLWALRCPERLI